MATPQTGRKAIAFPHLGRAADPNASSVNQEGVRFSSVDRDDLWKPLDILQREVMLPSASFFTSFFRPIHHALRSLAMTRHTAPTVVHFQRPRASHSRVAGALKSMTGAVMVIIAAGGARGASYGESKNENDRCDRSMTGACPVETLVFKGFSRSVTCSTIMEAKGPVFSRDARGSGGFVTEVATDTEYPRLLRNPLFSSSRPPNPGFRPRLGIKPGSAH
jgi:hypothetical protein